MLPNGAAARGVETTENHLFRDFSKMAGGTILVSRTQFGYVLRKFQPDFGGPGTPGHPPGGPNRVQIWTAKTLGRWKIVKNRGFSRFSQDCARGIGPNLLGGGPRARRACGDGRLGRGLARWAALGRFGDDFEAWGGWLGRRRDHEKSRFFEVFAGLRPWNRPKLARGWAPG